MLLRSAPSRVVVFVAAWYITSLVTLFSNKLILSEHGGTANTLALTQMCSTCLYGAIKVYGGVGTTKDPGELGDKVVKPRMFNRQGLERNKSICALPAGFLSKHVGGRSNAVCDSNFGPGRFEIRPHLVCGNSQELGAVLHRGMSRPLCTFWLFTNRMYIRVPCSTNLSWQFLERCTAGLCACLAPPAYDSRGQLVPHSGCRRSGAV